ncbi:c6 transcription factor [Fusarium sp. NRRL 52700]|nr:c6 transcription factor [Fusarium sp. NRRL 52700]
MMAEADSTVPQTSMHPAQNFGHYMSGADQSSPENGHGEKKHKNVKYRFLSSSEWAILARGVGGIRDIEDNKPVHPTNSFWPPRGIPQGLYRDCVYHRTVSSYSFHLIGFVRAILFVLQLMIGASITALSAGGQNDTAITVLAASNTVIAGLLALLHNSGIPDRYRYDKSEFQKVEDHIREVLATGIFIINTALTTRIHTSTSAATTDANAHADTSTSTDDSGINTDDTQEGSNRTQHTA